MLVLLNMTMKLSNLRKKNKIKEPLYVTKKIVKCNIGLHNAIMEPSNMKKKNKETTKCEKRIVKYDVRTAQCEDETVKCEKKK